MIIKNIKTGKKVSYKISFNKKLYYKVSLTVNPKKTQEEISYKNNKKVLKI
jgi:hypothetical protein